MGIVAFCPQGHRVKVKDYLAGRKGICPECGVSFRIPRESQPEPLAAPAPTLPAPASAATSATGLPVAKVISLDANLAASLPRALPLAAPGPGSGG
jgi:hypothetical protein